MTPKQFKKARERLGLSQASLAARLGMSDGRVVRNWESGNRDIPQFAIAALDLLLNGPEWIFGHAPDSDREFICHTIHPRFLATIAVDGDEVNDLSGITYACRTGEIFCEIVWQDTPPPRDDLRNIFQDAETALELYVQDCLE